VLCGTKEVFLGDALLLVAMPYVGGLQHPSYRLTKDVEVAHLGQLYNHMHHTQKDPRIVI
jgi:hypothetical protein